MVLGWFKCIALIVHFISIIITSAPPQTRQTLNPACLPKTSGIRSWRLGTPAGSGIQLRWWVGLQFSSVQFSHSVVSDSLRPHEPQHARPPCPSPTPRVYPNSCPSSRWCHPAISSSVVPFSSCPQSFPASGSFPMSQLFTSGGQSIRVSASTSVLPMNTQDWSPLGWTGWVSLQSLIHTKAPHDQGATCSLEAPLGPRREARERMGSPEKGKAVYQGPGERQPLRGWRLMLPT